MLNACGVQQSDEFDGTSLDGKWDVIRDSGDWRVENGGLQLPINSGSLYGIGGNAEDIIVQEAPDGAFEVTAKITAEVTENYHQAGLRLYSDDENWASVHLISAGGNRDVEFIYEAQGNPRNEGADKLGGVPAGFPTTYYVRLDLRRHRPAGVVLRRRRDVLPGRPARSDEHLHRAEDRPGRGVGRSDDQPDGDVRLDPLRARRHERRHRPQRRVHRATGSTSAAGTPSSGRTPPSTRWPTAS